MIDGNRIVVIEEERFEEILSSIEKNHPAKQEEEQIWNLKDAAQNFDVSEKTISRWVKYHDMPMRKIGNTVRGLKSEIIEWFRDNGILLST